MLGAGAPAAAFLDAAADDTEVVRAQLTEGLLAEAQLVHLGGLHVARYEQTSCRSQLAQAPEIAWVWCDMRVATTAADCDAGRYPSPHPKQISDELTFPGDGER